MESLTSAPTGSESLLGQVKRLSSTALSLAAFFTEQAESLDREDQAARLKALRSLITEELDRVKRSEDSAERAAGDINLMLSLGGLAVRLLAPKNEFLSTISRLPSNHDDRRSRFGNILICVGPGGLPNDVKVVSISESVRTDRRAESEVVNEYQKKGFLLFCEKAFSRLIDNLVEGIRSGELRLPISREKLGEMRTSRDLSS